MKRATSVSLILAGVFVGAFYLLTAPRPLSSDHIPSHEVNLANGERMFWAGGCPSCHSDGDDAETQRLSGGLEMLTPFGTFLVPNISPHAEFGIGAWTDVEFVNAMVRGVSPTGRHYYPAFPYTNYQNMRTEDLLDLKGYLNTLPSSSNQVREHRLKFPFNVRRGLGLWKLRYLKKFSPASETGLTPEIERGRYLVRGPAHCGACHTPRDAFGGTIEDRFLAGAASLEIEPGSNKENAGRVPNITPHEDGIGDWSESDIAYSLETGFDPDFDTFGGSMVHVQENMAKLPPEDRAAIAAYLKSVAAIPTNSPE